MRFGTFEADLATRELRKSGVRIKLQGQPFEILVMLLERPAELVTREELQQRLWPTDTFVDFDHDLKLQARCAPATASRSRWPQLDSIAAPTC